MTQLPRTYRRVKKRYPSVVKAYEDLGAEVAGAGPLEPRVRELVKLGMAAAMGSEGSVASHARRAIEAGVTREEIEHALLLGATTIGFARSMAALNWATEAIDGD
jgi:AhpD family alkylhydroperoxidase